MMLKDKASVDDHVLHLLSKCSASNERKRLGFQIAKLYLEIQEADAAKVYLEQYIEWNKSSCDGFFLLGHVCELMGDIQAALDNYKLAIKNGYTNIDGITHASNLAAVNCNSEQDFKFWSTFVAKHCPKFNVLLTLLDKQSKIDQSDGLQLLSLIEIHLNKCSDPALCIRYYDVLCKQKQFNRVLDHCLSCVNNLMYFDSAFWFRSSLNIIENITDSNIEGVDIKSALCVVLAMMSLRQTEKTSCISDFLNDLNKLYSQIHHLSSVVHTNIRCHAIEWLLFYSGVCAQRTSITSDIAWKFYSRVRQTVDTWNDTDCLSLQLRRAIVLSTFEHSIQAAYVLHRFHTGENNTSLTDKNTWMQLFSAMCKSVPHVISFDGSVGSEELLPLENTRELKPKDLWNFAIGKSYLAVPEGLNLLLWVCAQQTDANDVSNDDTILTDDRVDFIIDVVSKNFKELQTVGYPLPNPLMREDTVNTMNTNIPTAEDVCQLDIVCFLMGCFLQLAISSQAKDVSESGTDFSFNSNILRAPMCLAPTTFLPSPVQRQWWTALVSPNKSDTDDPVLSPIFQCGIGQLRLITRPAQCFTNQSGVLPTPLLFRLANCLMRHAVRLRKGQLACWFLAYWQSALHYHVFGRPPPRTPTAGGRFSARGLCMPICSSLSGITTVSTCSSPLSTREATPMSKSELPAKPRQQQQYHLLFGMPSGFNWWLGVRVDGSSAKSPSAYYANIGLVCLLQEFKQKKKKADGGHGHAFADGDSSTVNTLLRLVDHGPPNRGRWPAEAYQLASDLVAMDAAQFNDLKAKRYLELASTADGLAAGENGGLNDLRPRTMLNWSNTGRLFTESTPLRLVNSPDVSLPSSGKLLTKSEQVLQYRTANLSPSNTFAPQRNITAHDVLWGNKPSNELWIRTPPKVVTSESVDRRLVNVTERCDEKNDAESEFQDMLMSTLVSTWQTLVTSLSTQLAETKVELDRSRQLNERVSKQLEDTSHQLSELMRKFSDLQLTPQTRQQQSAGDAAEAVVHQLQVPIRELTHTLIDLRHWLPDGLAAAATAAVNVQVLSSANTARSLPVDDGVASGIAALLQQVYGGGGGPLGGQMVHQQQLQQPAPAAQATCRLSAGHAAGLGGVVTANSGGLGGSPQPAYYPTKPVGQSVNPQLVPSYPVASAHSINTPHGFMASSGPCSTDNHLDVSASQVVTSYPTGSFPTVLSSREDVKSKPDAAAAANEGRSKQVAFNLDLFRVATTKSTTISAGQSPTVQPTTGVCKSTPTTFGQLSFTANRSANLDSSAATTTTTTPNRQQGDSWLRPAQPKQTSSITPTKLDHSDQQQPDEVADEYEPQVDFKPVLEVLPDLVDQETGEENEERLFVDRARLFRWDRSSELWKTRGVGEVCILHSLATAKCRIVMRRDQVKKLCANHVLSSQIKITLHEKDSRMAYWFARDFSESSDGKDEMFMIQLKTADRLTTFLNTFRSCCSSTPVTGADAQATNRSFSPATTKPPETDGKQLNSSKPDDILARLAPKPGEWSCPTCLLRNAPTASACLACGSRKADDASDRDTMSAVSATKPAGAVDSLMKKFAPQPGSWDCPTCMLRNAASADHCPACQTKKHGLNESLGKPVCPTTASATSLFGGFSMSSRGFVFGQASSTTPMVTAAASTDNQSATTRAYSSKPLFGFTAASNTAVKTPSVPSFTIGQPSIGPSTFTFGNQKAFEAKDKKATVATTTTSTPLLFGQPIVSTASLVQPDKAQQKQADKPNAFAAISLTDGLSKPQTGGFTFSFDATNLNRTPVKDTSKPGATSKASLEESDDSHVEQVDEDKLVFKPVLEVIPDKVELRTGEEEEEVVFVARAKLFRWRAGAWRERGVGELKLLHETKSGLFRCLMRRDHVLKVCCNHRITTGMHLEPMDGGSGRAWIWWAIDFTEGQDGEKDSSELVEETVAPGGRRETFAVRFKTTEDADGFSAAFTRAVCAAEKRGEKPNGESDNDDVVVVVDTSLVTEDQLSRARELKLPDSFYAYENGHVSGESEQLTAQELAEEDAILDAAVQRVSTPRKQSSSPTQLTLTTTSAAEKSATAAYVPKVTGFVDFSSLSAGFSQDAKPSWGGDANSHWSSAVAPLFSQQQQQPNKSATEETTTAADSHADDYDPHYDPVISLPELVEKRTGEEDELCLFLCRCRVYRFVDNAWKERGVGDMKVLVEPVRMPDDLPKLGDRDVVPVSVELPAASRARLLMRRDQVLKLCVNQLIGVDRPTFSPFGSSAKNSLCWFCEDYSEGDASRETLAVRFKHESDATEFKSAVARAQALLAKRSS